MALVHKYVNNIPKEESEFVNPGKKCFSKSAKSEEGSPSSTQYTGPR
jgi:hypothetical protein